MGAILYFHQKEKRKAAEGEEFISRRLLYQLKKGLDAQASQGKKILRRGEIAA